MMFVLVCVRCVWVSLGCLETYPLLGELSCALVLAVTEEFDDAALVWCESVRGRVLAR